MGTDMQRRAAEEGLTMTQYTIRRTLDCDSDSSPPPGLQPGRGLITRAAVRYCLNRSTLDRPEVASVLVDVKRREQLEEAAAAVNG